MVESNAFEGCDRLKYIKLPEALEKMGSRCFAKSGLEKVALRPMISENYADVFYECDSLTTVKLLNGTETIAEGWFPEGKIETVIFSESVTYIQDRAFYGWISLKQV